MKVLTKIVGDLEEDLQFQWDKEIRNNLISKKSELEEMRTKMAILAREQARIRWLKEGIKTRSFFTPLLK